MVKNLLLFFFVLYSIAVRAQNADFDIRKESMYLPAPQQTGKFDHSITVAMIYLPKDWLEHSVAGPMVDYKANFALPKGFAINGNFKTLFVATEIRLGPSWNYSLNDHLHAAVGYQFAFNFGILREFGYNNTLILLQHHPSLRVGYDSKNTAVTFQARLDLISDAKLTLDDYGGDNMVNDAFNGYSFGLFFEQRFTRTRSICIGFLTDFDKFHILGWPALNTVQHKYFIPELNIGFKL